MDTKNSSIATLNLNFGKNEEKNPFDQIESQKEMTEEKPLLDGRDYDDSYAMMLKLNQERIIEKEKKKVWRIENFKKYVETLLSDKGLLICVIILFIFIITALVSIYYLHDEETFYLYKGNHIEINDKNLHFELTNYLNKPVLNGLFWKSKSNKVLPYDCSVYNSSRNDVCLYWKKLMKLQISTQAYPQFNSSCYTVNWSKIKNDQHQQDCFNLDDNYWFGGGVVEGSEWILNRLRSIREKFVVRGYQHKGFIKGIIDKSWYTSNGIGIFVDEHSDIEISINEQLEFKANNKGGQFCLFSGHSNLKYTICVTPSITVAREIFAPIIGKLREPPFNTTKINFSIPYWSDRYIKTPNFHQSNVLSYINNIAKYDHQTILLENDFQKNVGDLSFDEKQFPNISEIVDKIHKLNFRISSPVHTYLEPKSEFFKIALEKDYLIKLQDELNPALTFWKDDLNNRNVAVGAIELSENASSWLIERIENFQNTYSIDSVHFIEGTISKFYFDNFNNQNQRDPNLYTKKLNALAEKYEAFVPVETAYMSQHLEIILKTSRKKSSWQGLKTVIPTALSLGLAGYNLFIPETVGGSIDGRHIDKELFIRWLQVNTFLPFQHYSFPIDLLGQHVVDIFHSLNSLRSKVVIPALHKFYSKNGKKFQPMIRPVWWYSPLEKDAFECQNEFILAGKLLVAPIVEEGSRTRDIFIPHGIWEDKEEDVFYIGPKWLFNYSVPLEKIAYFVNKL